MAAALSSGSGINDSVAYRIMARGMASKWRNGSSCINIGSVSNNQSAKPSS